MALPEGTYPVKLVGLQRDKRGRLPGTVYDLYRYKVIGHNVHVTQAVVVGHRLEAARTVGERTRNEIEDALGKGLRDVAEADISVNADARYTYNEIKQIRKVTTNVQQQP